MNITPISELPERKKEKFSNNPVMDYFEEFMKMNTKYAKVTIGTLEYSSDDIAYHALHNMAKYYKLPITVKSINGRIYFIRKDI